MFPLAKYCRPTSFEFVSLAKLLLHQTHERNQSLHLAPKRYSLYTVTNFEFHKTKSQKNLLKHGIDFVDAQLLWNDPRLLEVPAKTKDEARFLVIGVIGTKNWSAVVTYRTPNVRIISCRPSRIEEVALYES
jgi:uncharacterized protein